MERRARRPVPGRAGSRTERSAISRWNLDVTGSEEFLPPAEVDALAPAVAAAAASLEDGTAPGSDFLGWRDLPVSVPEDELAAVEAAAAAARADSDTYVVTGIGGSYLGARAVLEALAPDGGPEILFAGTGLCGRTLRSFLDAIEADRSIDPKSLKINSSVGEIAERIARAYGLSRPREA